MNLLPCPVCKSKKLKLVSYAPSAKDAPDLWELEVDGFMPLIWFKRVECCDCGATVPQLVMTLDQAEDYWNANNEKTGTRYVMQRIAEEALTATEPPKEDVE